MGHKILGRERLLKMHAFDIEKVQIQLPNGVVRDYDLVAHGPAVTILPLTKDGRILYVKQFRLGAEKELLELPAGVINYGEDPDPATARELREETGYEANDIIKIGCFYMGAGYSSEYMHVYLARDLHWNPLPQDDDEFLEPLSYTVEESYRMAESGELEDSKTYVALLMAQKYIRS